VTIVLDASALLATLLGEPGAERVDANIDGAIMSTVNLAEVAGHLARAGADRAKLRKILGEPPLVYLAPDEALAIEAGAMRPLAEPFGLSLGDRMCLALARRLDATALTADRAWVDAATTLSVRVELIR
jgi:ribonuclease VapC